MRGYLDRGYTTVKMKIGSASLVEDLKRIEAVLTIVGDGRSLAVDANGCFGLDTALAYAAALEPYGLFWYEEAGDPLDFALQAELSARYAGAIATGENLFSHQDARNLLRYGGMDPNRDWLQFDCALSYGLVEYLRTLDVLKQNGWSNRQGRAARRPSDVAQHRGGLAPRRKRILSRRVPAFWRLCGRHGRRRGSCPACPIGRVLDLRPSETCLRCSARSCMLDRHMRIRHKGQTNPRGCP